MKDRSLYPQTWEPMLDKERCKIVDLPATSNEFSLVYARFMKSMSCYRVLQIQSPTSGSGTTTPTLSSGCMRRMMEGSMSSIFFMVLAKLLQKPSVGQKKDLTCATHVKECGAGQLFCRQCKVLGLLCLL